MHFTTTISISLVLFLIGLECVMLLSAHELLRHVRENVVLTVVMHEDVSEDVLFRVDRVIANAKYTLDYRYISKEDALQEHIHHLGEDPRKFLGYNPLSDAYEIRLKALYVQSDSVASIEANLLNLPDVDRVIYQEDILHSLDKNLGEASLVLSVVALALLIIALVLISNTIQLQVYSKRFLINTMRLVGATPWVIKWPFIRRNLWMGAEASVVAIGMLAIAYYYSKSRLGIVLFPLEATNTLLLTGLVLGSGVLITFMASLSATNKYIRMKTNNLYEI
jgi:cell division transport system permease protein